MAVQNLRHIGSIHVFRPCDRIATSQGYLYDKCRHLPTSHRSNITSVSPFEIAFYMNGCVTQTHDSLYLVDGNVALVAPHTTGRCTIFRVHQSILAKNSAVFDTMFTLPAATNANETYEGAPLVQLPDGAEDIESLLRILYHDW
jgi:hypothetical protein